MKSAKKKIVIVAAALAVMAIIPAVYFGLREPRAEPAINHSRVNAFI
jgi:hypothetical protein